MIFIVNVYKGDDLVMSVNCEVSVKNSGGSNNTDLVEKYLSTDDPEMKSDLKTRIILNYSYIVDIIVSKMIKQYYGYFEKGDLYSYGIIGLIDAINKFNSAIGVQFQTYAPIRIQGEILDFIRSQDWASRNVRKKLMSVQRACNALVVENNRVPTIKEIADRICLRESAVRKIMHLDNMFNLMHIDFNDICRASSIDSVRSMDDPYYIVEKKDILETIHAFIETLPQREKTVITLVYNERIPMKIIGERVGLSESRVSQIHEKIIRSLRAILMDG